MLWQLCTCPTYRHSASEQKLSMPVHSTLLYDFGPTCHISIIMKFNKHNSFKLDCGKGMQVPILVWHWQCFALRLGGVCIIYLL